VGKARARSRLSEPGLGEAERQCDHTNVETVAAGGKPEKIGKVEKFEKPEKPEKPENPRAREAREAREARAARADRKAGTLIEIDDRSARWRPPRWSVVLWPARCMRQDGERWRMRSCAMIVGLAFALHWAGPAFADEDESHWRLSTSYNYLKGDYGTGDDVEITYVPVTAGVKFDRSRWTHRAVSAHDRAERGPDRRWCRRQQEQAGDDPAAKTTEDGLGDVLLRTSYVVLEEQPEHPLLPEVEPYLKIKFPTADEDRGLGTGEFDETIVSISASSFSSG